MNNCFQILLRGVLRVVRKFSGGVVLYFRVLFHFLLPNFWTSFEEVFEVPPLLTTLPPVCIYASRNPPSNKWYINHRYWWSTHFWKYKKYKYINFWNIIAKVQVGCHTDLLFSKEKLDRFPRLVFKFEVENSTVKVANPFGGLIYIIVSWIFSQKLI